MECQQEKNLFHYPCTYPDCPRKGLYCECLAYHRERGELAACLFPAEAEKTYDRSIDKFIEDHQ